MEKSIKKSIEKSISKNSLLNHRTFLLWHFISDFVH
jgi:hypothetical protein